MVSQLSHISSLASTAENGTYFSEFASSLISEGYKPISIYSILPYPDRPEKYEKRPGCSIDGEFIKFDASLSSWDRKFKHYGSRLFQNCKGLGLLMGQPGKDGLYINRLDWDSPNGHSEIIALFSGLNVLIHKTVSGNLAVLWKSTVKQQPGSPCLYKGKEVGHGAWWALLPTPDQIIQDCSFSELATLDAPTLTSMGIALSKPLDLIQDDDPDFGSPNDPPSPPTSSTAQSDDRSDHELRRFQTCLSIVHLGTLLDLTYAPLFENDELGYSDDHHPWVQLVHVLQSLCHSYPHKEEEFKAVFLDFCKKFPKYDEYTETKIDEELAREAPSNRLDIATLESMAKTIKNRLYNISDPVKKQDAIQALKKIDPPKTKDLVALFESAFLNFPHNPEKENQILLDNFCPNIFRDYEQFKTGKIRSQNRSSAIPEWGISSDHLGEILKKLPGTKTLVDYTQQKGLDSALMLFSYLVNMRVVVPKNYVRFDYNGNPVNNGLFVFLVGSTIAGKSFYTDVSYVYEPWDLGLIDTNKSLKKDYEKELARYQIKIRDYKKNPDTSSFPNKPDQPKEQASWAVSAFTYQALQETMRNTDYGRLLLIEEAATQIGVDTSGQNKGIAEVLASYSAIFNGQNPGESKISRDTSGISNFSVSFYAGLQPGFLRDYIKPAKDPSNFFGRCILISMPESIEEKRTNLTLKYVRNSILEVLNQIKKSYEEVIVKEYDDLLPKNMTGTRLLNETVYPDCKAVDTYLHQVWLLMQQYKGKGQRFNHLGKVKPNFWRIVQALEIAYTGTQTSFDWEDLYQDAIAISKWITDSCETVLQDLQSYVDDSVDEIDLKQEWRKALLDFYSVPSNSAKTLAQGFLKNRGDKAKKQLGAKYRNTIEEWAEELVTEDRLAHFGKSYKTV